MKKHLNAPKIHEAIVKQKIWVSEKVLQLDFNVSNEFSFEPGQFINIQISPTVYRAYSLCSDYKDNNQITIVADAKHNGFGSNYLNTLTISEEISFIGPSGRFILPTDLKPNLVFLATGTGISPLVAMLYKLKHIAYEGKIELYWGLRNPNHIFFKNILDGFENNLKNFKYHLCLSQPPKNWEGKEGRIDCHFNIDTNQNTQYFLCGNPNMVAQNTEELVSKGVLSSDIFYEKFTFAKDVNIKA